MKNLSNNNNKVNLLVNTLSGGGAERNVSRISLSLSKDIYKQIIIFGNESKVEYEFDGKIIKLDNKEDTGIFRRLFNLFVRLNSLSRLKKETTTISFMLYPNLLNALTSNKGKTILSIRNHMTMQVKTGNMSKIWTYIIKYIYIKADVITVVSEEIKKDLMENYNIPNSKIKVIYNSYDIENIVEKANEKLTSSEEEFFANPIIITAGRLTEQKGTHHLIRVFNKLQKDIPDLKLAILGEGRLYEDLNGLVKQYGLESKIKFFGFQSNPFKYIKKSSVFVLPSIFEGFPNSLSEAMACGVPVVATDCFSGPREILAPSEFKTKNLNYEISKDRYGILVPTLSGERVNYLNSLDSSEEKMYQILLEFFSKPELQRLFSQKSIERIHDFRTENIIKQWEEII